jgi:cytoskeletal protein RodZ
MPSIGDALRQERLRRGLSLEEVAERTRISARFVEALEAEEFDKLPGNFFARAFLRQYASFLGVDPRLVQPAVATLEEPAEAPPAEPPPETPRLHIAPIVSHAKPRLALKRWLGSIASFVLVVLACAVMYVIWQRVRTAPERTTAAPATPQAPAVAAPPAAEPAWPPSPAGPPAPIQLDIRASADVWVRVTADGAVLFSGTLRPGQLRTFQGKEAMSVLTGNAGGLEIAFQGKPLGTLGPRGHIRVIEFTPAGHRILERTPPPASGPAAAPDAATRGAAGA